MRLTKKDSEIYVFDGVAPKQALERVTHFAIAAHQDDVEIMAYHGIAECFGQKGKGFGAVVVADGGGSPRDGVYKEYTDTEMIQVRKAEQKKAAHIGEYSALALLMYPSKEIKDRAEDKLTEEIFDLLMTAKPKVVYTHNLADKHDTHIGVVLKTIKAIRKMPKASRPKQLLGCEVWRGLDWLDDKDKILLDTSAKPNLASALIGVFDSQVSGGKRYDLATSARWLANATYAASHSIDAYTHTAYAMDLTPLIKDDHMDISAFIEAHLMNFVNDVKSRLK
ncbi:MAG: PIG-L family deacetylase [Firmicutes bacterium]|nr:PIG-L family deacetylase [Bacillota bacterium]